jgi:hypothetical protein
MRYDKNEMNPLLVLKDELDVMIVHHYFLGWAKLRFSLGILKGQSLFINLIQIYHMSTFRSSMWKIGFSVCKTTDNNN